MFIQSTETFYLVLINSPLAAVESVKVRCINPSTHGLGDSFYKPSQVQFRRIETVRGRPFSGLSRDV